jgi:hypothetical protein
MIAAASVEPSLSFFAFLLCKLTLRLRLIGYAAARLDFLQ